VSLNLLLTRVLIIGLYSNNRPVDSSVRSQNCLTASLIHCRSLSNKITLLDYFIFDHKCDILFLTYTWLNSTHSDAFIQQPNFQIFINNRDTRSVERVAILVHNKLGTREVSVVFPPGVYLELECIDVHLKSSVTRCICVYRPPNKLIIV